MCSHPISFIFSFQPLFIYNRNPTIARSQYAFELCNSWAKIVFLTSLSLSPQRTHPSPFFLLIFFSFLFLLSISPSSLLSPVSFHARSPSLSHSSFFSLHFSLGSQLLQPDFPLPFHLFLFISPHQTRTPVE
jgi:hypothetical protein